MASLPLTRLDNIEEGKEGNYASSEIPLLGRITNYDLGLTLLPGSQTTQQDEVCSGLEVEENACGMGAGSSAVEETLSRPIGLAPEEIVYGIYDAKRNAPKTLDTGSRCPNSPKKEVAMAQTQPAPSSVSDVEEIADPSLNPARIGQIDSAWAAGDDDIPVKIIYARKRRRVEAPAPAKVVISRSRRLKPLNNLSSGNSGAVSGPHIDARGSQSMPPTSDQTKTFLQSARSASQELPFEQGSDRSASLSAVGQVTEGTTASQAESYKPSHIALPAIHSSFTKSQLHCSQHDCQHLTAFLSDLPTHSSHNRYPDSTRSMASGHLNMAGGLDPPLEQPWVHYNVPSHSIESSAHHLQNNVFQGLQPVAGRDLLTPSMSPDVSTMLPQDMIMQQTYSCDWRLIKLGQEIFPRIQNYPDLVDRVIGFIRTFPVNSNVQNSLPMDLSERNMRHHIIQQNGFITRQKAYTDRHTQDLERDITVLKEESAKLCSQTLQLSDQVKNIAEAKDSLVTKYALTHTQLEAKIKEYEELKEQYNTLKQQLDGGHSQGNFPIILPGLETITAASQHQTANMDSDSSRRSSGAAIDLTGDDDIPLTAPTSTSNSSPPTGNKDSQSVPATDFSLKRKNPSWLYTTPRPQTSTLSKKQRTDESRPSTTEGPPSAATASSYMGEVAPSAAEMKRREKADAREQEKKRKATLKDAERARKETEKETERVRKAKEKEDLRITKQLQSKQTKNERAKATKKVNKEKANPFTPELEEEQQRLFNTASASATMTSNNGSSLAATSYQLNGSATFVENVTGATTVSSMGTHFGQQQVAASDSTAGGDGLDDLFVDGTDLSTDQNAGIPQGSTEGELEIYDGDGNVAKPKVHREYIPPADGQPMGLAALAGKNVATVKANEKSILTAEEMAAKDAEDIEALLIQSENEELSESFHFDNAWDPERDIDTNQLTTNLAASRNHESSEESEEE